VPADEGVAVHWDRAITLAAIVFLASFSLFLFSGTLPIYLYRDRGFSLSTVGLLVGLAFGVQLVATLLSGPAIDRWGAGLALRVGPALYLAAALLFVVAPEVLPIAVARVLQGLGIALLLPAAYALLPSLVGPRQRATAFGVVGVIQNIALAIAPPLGLWLLNRGPRVLFGTAVATAAAGIAASWRLRAGRPSVARAGVFTYRASWTPLLAATFLTIVYWGVITAFLPIYVTQHHGGNVGWFFTADAIAIMLLRIPAGWMTDRIGTRWLLVAGIVLTDLAVLVLLWPPSLPVLVLSGAGTGAGAAFLIPPTLLELSRRSDEGDRGTAMALFSSAFAAALGVGSVGGTPLVAHFGFIATLVLSAAVCLAAAPIVVVTLRSGEDERLRLPPA
jgi:MFS family permease